MGQGAYDAGGYEIDYDPYDEGLEDGVWTQQDGTPIKVCNMSEGHIKNTIRICERAAKCANFSCEEDKWNSWVSIFTQELSTRPPIKKMRAKRSSKNKPSKTVKNLLAEVSGIKSTKIILKCHCGNVYTAKTADLRRGWGMSCSKRCAAIRRDYGRPAPTIV